MKAKMPELYSVNGEDRVPTIRLAELCLSVKRDIFIS